MRTHEDTYIRLAETGGYGGYTTVYIITAAGLKKSTESSGMVAAHTGKPQDITVSDTDICSAAGQIAETSSWCCSESFRNYLHEEAKTYLKDFDSDAEPLHICDYVTSVKHEDRETVVTTKSGHVLRFDRSVSAPSEGLPSNVMRVFLDLSEWEEAKRSVVFFYAGGRSFTPSDLNEQNFSIEY